MKVGKTLGGSQLLNIANLPAVHYPFVLGIPRQLPCAPFTVEHQDAISDSLFLLLKLFVTQDCSMMAFSSFCKQMLQEAMQDSGHLISTVAAIGGCLATVMVTNPREELKTQNSPHASGVSLCGHRTQSGPETLSQPQCGPHQSHGCGRTWMWQMPCPTPEQPVLECFCPMVRVSTQDREPLGPSSSSVPAADTMGDTDFVAWALRVAPECRNLHLHTPVGTTLAVAFIMLSPERPIPSPFQASPLSNGLWPDGT